MQTFTTTCDRCGFVSNDKPAIEISLYGGRVTQHADLCSDCLKDMWEWIHAEQ